MKNNHLRKIGYIASLVMIASLVSSAAVWGEDVTNTDTTTVTNSPSGARERALERRQERIADRENLTNTRQNGAVGGDICARISDLADQAQQRSGDIKTPQERRTNWETRKSDQDAKLAQLRTQWNANRDAQFTALEAKATTDAQKAAVKTFEATVKEAISAREAAVDGAKATFRAGVEKLIDQNGQGKTDNREAFQAAVKTAFDQAQASCDKGTDPATVRTQLRAALEKAKSNFQSGKQTVPKVGTDIQALIDARNKTMNDAMTAFRQTMEQARTALKTAFGDSASTSSN